MENNSLSEGAYYAIIIGPSVGGGCILLAVIILAIVCCYKDKKRRKNGKQESGSSNTSLVQDSRKVNFCLPMFSRQSRLDTSVDYNDYAPPTMVHPWTAAGKVFTIPMTPTDSSKLSTLESQSDQPHLNHDNPTTTTSPTSNKSTITNKYYYDFENYDNKNENKSPPTTIPDKTNTPEHVGDKPAMNTDESVVMRKSREVDHIVLNENVKGQSRSTVMSEVSWNNTLDNIFNSALSVHEVNSSLVGTRGSVFPS